NLRTCLTSVPHHQDLLLRYLARWRGMHHYRAVAIGSLSGLALQVVVPFRKRLCRRTTSLRENMALQVGLSSTLLRSGRPYLRLWCKEPFHHKDLAPEIHKMADLPPDSEPAPCNKFRFHRRDARRIEAARSQRLEARPGKTRI